VVAVVYRITYRDWVHLFWSAQIPLVGSFLVSGALLCRTWRDDAGALGSAKPREAVFKQEGSRWTLSGASLFLLMSATLGFAPLLLQIVFPANHPSLRETGQPIQRLLELASWGFGGPLPESLIPIADPARGIGYLPRDVTVPMGSTLIAAWLWIAFCVLAFGGRLVRSQRKRIAFYFVAPPLLGLCIQMGAADLVASVWGGFDSGFFGLESSRDSGIWTSDPVVLRSYGPVVLASLIAALALLFALAVQRTAPDSSAPE
jgi:hypothetical protein